ncbi:LacI family DNA-binding transcriptional regulator [Gordonia sp. HNM0687]|uniref:LacI family DNA-binding transcriptional regulator n=1 Tax=Gordonia mangrovi TaxID=2665643 RepID=A0A6L7GPZ7_9ACTN|nr:LacI family DNA-binding transcriptional regulator [Gordonia mangrovi]MXP20725.1 LacI family DNA-binding transcriptional regulator [Gordonia mangrovi]UVF78704.1 LacI family transcriptional regulator [Gordonia mangrovi]
MTGAESRDASPTLDEVARLAGVSRATASRAVNGGSRVSPRAQQAVAEAVHRLGYTPNQAARSLVTRRTQSVALVVPEPDERVFADPFFARTVHIVTRELSAHDYQVVLLLAGGDDQESRMLRFLGNRQVDGAIVVSHHRGDSLPDHLSDLGLPSAFIGRPWSNSDRLSWVDTDNVAGGLEATRLLIDRGCRRIATIAGPTDMTAGVDRLDGWKQAMQSAGRRPDAIGYGDFTPEGGAYACRQLLEAHPDLDGIVVASDLMAVGAMEVLAAAGKQIPRDIAITGADDLGVAERTDPPLTTLRNPLSEMAAEAVTLLLGQLDGGSAAPRRVVFAPTLIRRASA